MKKIKLAIVVMAIILSTVTPAISVYATETAETVSVEEYQKLENSYEQLAEKYQSEKNFSRAVIYVLIFVIAILIVLMINIIVFCFKSSDEEFDDELVEEKPKKKKEPQEVEMQKEQPKKELPKKELPKQEASKKVTAIKVEPVKNNIEVLDFNDED